MDLPAKSPTVVYKEMDEGAVLYCTRTEVYFGLNSVGAVIWNRLPEDPDPDRAGRLEQFIDRLEEVFPQVERDRLVADVREFLAELQESELVDYAGPGEIRP